MFQQFHFKFPSTLPYPYTAKMQRNVIRINRFILEFSSLRVRVCVSHNTYFRTEMWRHVVSAVGRVYRTVCIVCIEQ